MNFVIGGDGPKRIDIEEMIEKYSLQSRVQMLGELIHSDVRDKLLIKGKENWCFYVLKMVKWEYRCVIFLIN